MAAYSAKNAPVRYGTTVVTVTKWAVTDETDELETTNMESSGRHECIGGIKKMTANLTLNDDGAANLRDIGFISGATLQNIYLYQNTTAGPKWWIKYGFIRSFQQDADVKGTMANTIQITATAEWVGPTGNAVT